MEYLLFYSLLVRIDTTLQFTLQSYLVNLLQNLVFPAGIHGVET
jgi:hypothetical protein